jgi:hypothetical protein
MDHFRQALIFVEKRIVINPEHAGIGLFVVGDVGIACDDETDAPFGQLVING